MLLKFQERLVLPSLLPAEGTFLTLKMVRVLREELTPSDAEWKDFEIKHNGSQVTWNEAKAKEKDVEINDIMKGIIVEALKKLDSDGKLTTQHLTLYEKFVE